MAESVYSISAVLSVGGANASFATWNSGTALNSTAQLVNNDYSFNSIVVSLSQTTTITGGIVTFEGSLDGVTFFPLQGFTPGTGVTVGPTYTLQANTYAVFGFNLTAIPYFQVRLSTVIAGTGAVTIGYAADSFVNTIAVNGQVTTLQGTNPWIITGTLTNNNAVPAATNVGVLPALAATAYTTNTYTNGDQVLLVTDLHGAINGDIQAVAGVQLGSTAVVNFGSAPAAAAVPAVNSSIFAGVTGITATGTSLNVNVTNPAAPFTVVGNLTNNNAAPAANNLGVLPAIAETAYATVTYTTGNQVLPVTDLHGALNQDLQAIGGTAVRSNQTTTAAGVLDVNNVGIDGVTIVTAAAGVQKVGIVGNTGAALDAAGQNAASPANELLVAGQFNTMPTTITTGNVSPLQVDAIGSLKGANSGTSNTAAAAWTSATALNTAVTLYSATFSYNTIIVTLNQTTTITAGAVTFEVSNDNANWVASSGIDYVNDGNDVQSYTLQANTYKTLKFNIGGWQYFRVRLSAVITGTGTVTVGYATNSNGVPPTKVQELKDSGRTYVTFVLDAITAPAAGAEALASMSINKAGTASTATTYTVTAGKTFRVQSMSLGVSSASGAQDAKARLRSAAAVLATSPILITLTSGASGGKTAGNADQVVPDGLEIAGGQQLGISTVQFNGTTGLVTVTVVGYEY